MTQVKAIIELVNGWMAVRCESGTGGTRTVGSLLRAINSPSKARDIQGKTCFVINTRSEDVQAGLITALFGKDNYRSLV